MWEYDVCFNEDGKTREECGLVAGFSLNEALSNLCDRFGEDNIEDISLSFVRDEKVLPYKEEAGKSLKQYFEDM